MIFVLLSENRNEACGGWNTYCKIRGIQMGQLIQSKSAITRCGGSRAAITGIPVDGSA